MTKKYSISDLHYSAKVNNGKCLSKEYISLYFPVEWRCEKGHRFSMPHLIVRQGGWCEQCRKDESKQEKLEELIKYAAKKGGKLLSKKYVNTSTKLKWVCERKHSFELEPDKIKKGAWCKLCNRFDKQQKDFPIVKKVIQKKNGVYLTDVYNGSLTKLKIRCEQGHVFSTRAYHIKNGHSWCSYCSGKAKHTLEELQILAKSKKGKCLSKKYINNLTLMTWQCMRNHVWKNQASKILSGQWCPECRKINLSERFRTDIKVIQKFAKERSGKLLSKRYINALTPVKWQCGNRHIWKATYGSVKFGSWCPACANKNRIITRRENQKKKNKVK